jgi:hypothetical protein
VNCQARYIPSHPGRGAFLPEIVDNAKRVNQYSSIDEPQRLSRLAGRRRDTKSTAVARSPAIHATHASGIQENDA